jgi:uncharacterized membrane protein
MTGLSLLLFGMTFMYWNFRPDVNFLLTKQDVVFNPVWRSAFYIHIFGGMLAIALGPFQFVKYLRRQYPATHRFMGKMYVMSILFIAAPSGFLMAFYANGGIAASIGFMLMSILWFYTTFMALNTARNKKFAEHGKWMVRSYAMTFSAVTLRLWVPFLSLAIGMEELSIIVVTAWISWIFNLLGAELILKMKLKVLSV